MLPKIGRVHAAQGSQKLAISVLKWVWPRDKILQVAAIICMAVCKKTLRRSSSLQIALHCQAHKVTSQSLKQEDMRLV